jgi:hypothetical protein
MCEIQVEADILLISKNAMAYNEKKDILSPLQNITKVGQQK